MKCAILSDIHGNYDALVAVLRDIDKRDDVRQIISLGDNIGYGPESSYVLNELMRRKVLSVQGNHERAMFDLTIFEELNFQVQENNAEIRLGLTEEQLAYCKELPAFMQQEQAYFVHGFPPECTETYLSTVEDAELVKYLSSSSSSVTFVGHTHHLSLIKYGKSGLEKLSLYEGITPLARTHRYIVSAGSVGQPRNKDKRAQYLLWDAEEFILETRFVEYDAKSCAAKIRALNWPEMYALRLLAPHS